ncbi:MAG: aspartate kinase [Bacteroidales bacterium]|nr:aspartate kinase [Bacteroidales bacterium]
MKVLKFGGTSVGSAQRMKGVAELICKEKGNLVVLSAMSGTTNALLEIASYLRNGNPEGATDASRRLEKKYLSHITELYSTKEMQGSAREFIKSTFAFICSLGKEVFGSAEEKALVAQGELMSSRMLADYLIEKGVKAVLLQAPDFLRKDSQGEPDQQYLKEKLPQILKAHKEAEVFITQGFICLGADGRPDNLGRGGSDYSASLFGAAIGASEILIWTDIDGMHNNDPRVVEGTRPVRHLHFEEAAELGYFGAKILHPTCVLPAKFANIPVRLLNTMDPSAQGTVINNESDPGTIKAVAAKDNITAISIKSSRMLLAHGFLRKVFEIFESYKTPIDMITTSEVGVSMSIDDTTQLKGIVQDLRRYGSVSVDSDMCIICVVGDMDWENVGFESRAMDAMRDIPVRMVSYGGSNWNISFLIREEDKERALKSLSKCLFNDAQG